MTKFIMLFIFFNFALFQEPAPYFKINTDKLLGGNEKAVLKDYDFMTCLFLNQIDSTALKNIHTEENQFIREEGGYIYLFISGKFAQAPQKGNIISISIRNKKTRLSMTVFIRIASDLDYGMPVEVTNLHFTPGNYYLDLCRGNTQSSPYTIDLGVIKTMHSCTYSKINKQILAYKCP